MKFVPGSSSVGIIGTEHPPPPPIQCWSFLSEPGSLEKTTLNRGSGVLFQRLLAGIVFAMYAYHYTCMDKTRGARREIRMTMRHQT